MDGIKAFEALQISLLRVFLPDDPAYNNEQDIWHKPSFYSQTRIYQGVAWHNRANPGS